MTVLAFPDTTGQPTDGSFQYTANGVIYSWNGSYWAANNQQGFDQRYVEVAGDVMTGDLTVPSLNGGPLAGFRNQLINSDFRVWQRGGSVVHGVVEGGYVADRWGTGASSTTSQRAKYGGIPVAEVLGASYLLQGVELYVDPFSGTPSSPFTVGSVWTLSYYATKAPDGAVSNIAQFRDSANDGTAAANPVDIAVVPTPTATGETLGSGNELVRYSTTFTITGTPAPTNRCAVFHIAGNSANVDFAYAQLEPGPVASVFEQRAISMELAMCQRYYQKVGGAAMPIATGFITTGNTSALHISYKTEMRAAPTISSSGTTNDYALYGEGAPRTITALPFAVLSGTTDAQLQVDGTAFPGVGTTAMLRIAGAAGAVNFDAEL